MYGHRRRAFLMAPVMLVTDTNGVIRVKLRAGGRKVAPAGGRPLRAAPWKAANADRGLCGSGALGYYVYYVLRLCSRVPAMAGAVQRKHFISAALFGTVGSLPPVNARHHSTARTAQLPGRV